MKGSGVAGRCYTPPADWAITFSGALRAQHPAATLSAGKLIRGFALRTLGQLPSLWTVEAGPSLAFETGPVVIRQGEAVELKSGSRIAAMCEQYENGLIESIRKCIDFFPGVKKPAQWRDRLFRISRG